MEFIPAPIQPTSTEVTVANAANPITKKRRKGSLRRPGIGQVKIAHYHRQRDLMSRHIIDCRLLSASMTYDIFSISRLRGKCRVEYVPNGEELDPLKNSPDCFYFHQVCCFPSIYLHHPLNHYPGLFHRLLKTKPHILPVMEDTLQTRFMSN